MHLYFHTDALSPTSQHINRVHSLPSLLCKLKQARRSFRSRDRASSFRLRFGHFGPFCILTVPHAMLQGSDFHGRFLAWSALICYAVGFNACLRQGKVVNGWDFCPWLEEGLVSHSFAMEGAVERHPDATNKHLQEPEERRLAAAS